MKKIIKKLNTAVCHIAMYISQGQCLHSLSRFRVKAVFTHSIKGQLSRNKSCVNSMQGQKSCQYEYLLAKKGKTLSTTCKLTCNRRIFA